MTDPHDPWTPAAAPPVPEDGHGLATVVLPPTGPVPAIGETPYASAGDVPVVTCRRCNLSIRASSRFCSACGTDQDPERASAEMHHAEGETLGQWRTVRGVIVFYLIYLCTVVPLIWLPVEEKATGMRVVGILDAMIIVFFCFPMRRQLLSALKPTRLAGLTAVVGVASLLAILPINLGYHYLLRSYFHVQSQDQQSLFRLFENAGYGIWTQILVIAVMPGIWEELAFRGIIQGQLSKVVAPREALVLTAALFAIIHGAWLSIPYLFGLALVLGMLRQRSGSLLPGIAVHIIHNASIVMLARYGL